MSALIIPLTSDHYQDFKIALESTDYFFVIQWNERSAFWTLDIYTAGKALVKGGMVLRAGYSLLDQYSDELLPPGKIKMIDQNGGGVDPSYDDLGTRVVMLYEPSV
jgi:hypothetical protein